MIYYSHVNEDNRLERDLLNAGRFSTVVAICGSGERVLSLMDCNSCKRIVVVDCNKDAIFLLQLEIAALKQLSVDDYLRFIGHDNSTGEDRIAFFRLLIKYLPEEANAFWQENLLLIKKGILYIGHYERFLERVRPLTNAWMGKSFQNIFDKQDLQPVFSAARWKLLQQVFSYKMVYRLLGNRDIAFIGSSTELKRIPVALDKIIRNGKASSSFIMHLVFKGNLLEMNQKELPPSLQKKILEDIKDRLLKNMIEIKYHVEDLLHFLQNEKETQAPVFYSISDILSFSDFDYLHSIIKQTAFNQNCIVCRSFLRNRLTTSDLSLLNCYGKLCVHDDEDSTGMYQVFSLTHQCQDAN